MWDRARRYRTVIWHSLYGVPCALLGLFDALRGVDLGPILNGYMPTEKVAAIGVAISLTSIFMHFFADTRMQSLRDDGEK